MHLLSRGLLAAVLSCAVLAPVAAAAPVTVNLRIEGASRTLFEGPVTTDVRTFRFTDNPTEHECDATTVGGPSTTPVVTRGAVITQAALSTPFSMTGSWSNSYGPSFSTIDGDPVSYDSNTGAYLVEYKNWQSAGLGACGDEVANGDDVLFAYGQYDQHLLRLSGPSTAAPGQPVTVKVTDGSTGAAVAGAVVDGRTTGADGTAVVGPYDTRGDHDLKATKPTFVRSNRDRVCVTDGNDGYCGTTVPGQPATTTAPSGAPVAACASDGNDGRCGNRDGEAPQGFIRGIRDRAVFSRRHAPRTLHGIVVAPNAATRSAGDPSGLAAVRLRLTRDDRGRCATFSGSYERFRRARCGASHGAWFATGTSADWSYLLPAGLPRGRYVLDVEAVDKAGNADVKRKRGGNRVTFVVR